MTGIESKALGGKEEAKPVVRWKLIGLGVAIGALLAPLLTTLGLAIAGRGPLLEALSAFELWLVAMAFSSLPSALLLSTLPLRLARGGAGSLWREPWLLLRLWASLLATWLFIAIPAGAELDGLVPWLLVLVGSGLCTGLCALCIQLAVYRRLGNAPAP